MSEMAMSSHLLRGLLPFPHVQFWETETSWRLDRSHRGGHRRDIPCLVDASHVRTVNALEAHSLTSDGVLSVIAWFRQSAKVTFTTSIATTLPPRTTTDTVFSAVTGPF